MKLFVYDHCPYCVKARMIFGLKNIPFELITLLNDDEQTPISMIGKKMVPILEKKPGQFMAESIDIVEFIDTQNPPALVAPEEDITLLETLSRATNPYYSLAMPRWIDSGMEEFKTPGARKYFQDKKEQMTGPFTTALQNTDAFKKEIAPILLQIEDKIAQNKTTTKSADSSEENQWYLGKQASFNDFHLFAFLRGLSIVKGLNFPPLTTAYAKYCVQKTQVPLNTDIAL